MKRMLENIKNKLQDMTTTHSSMETFWVWNSNKIQLSHQIYWWAWTHWTTRELLSTEVLLTSSHYSPTLHWSMACLLLAQSKWSTRWQLWLSSSSQDEDLLMKQQHKSNIPWENNQDMCQSCQNEPTHPNSDWPISQLFMLHQRFGRSR